MMGVRFDPQRGLVVVHARLWGPNGNAILRLALDTGATASLLNVGPLVALRYDPALATDRVQVTTGSSVEFVPRVILDKIQALEQERTSFPVLSHTMPPNAGVDGLLGLDFLRGQRLSVDFRSGEITLA